MVKKHPRAFQMGTLMTRGCLEIRRLNVCVEGDIRRPFLNCCDSKGQKVRLASLEKKKSLSQCLY